MANLAGAQADPPSAFPTTPGALQEIVEERVYYYRASTYAPPVDVVVHDAAATSFATPEDTTIAAISAMARGDYLAFRATWDAPSRQLMEQRDRTLGRTPDDWTAQWSQLFAGRTARLTHRIESGRYVIVVYRLVRTDGAEKDAEAPELLTVLAPQEDGRWLATQELAADPVVGFWRTPDHRPRTLVREPRR